MKKYLLSFLFLALFSLSYAENAPINQRPLPEAITLEQQEREERDMGYFTDSPLGFYPPATRYIAEISPYTDTIRLDDGSLWRTNPSNRSDLFRWAVNDMVVISQNTSWFSSFRFRLTNRTAQSYAQAELSLGPILGGALTHRAIAVDPFNGQIILENGSRWEIAYADNSVFSQWLINDTIMIGMNRSWFSSGDFILIDVESNSFVRANLVQ